MAISGVVPRAAKCGELRCGGQGRQGASMDMSEEFHLVAHLGWMFGALGLPDWMLNAPLTC